MATPRYSTKRARIHLEVYGSGILEDAFNIESANVSFAEEDLKKFSTTEVRGVIAREILSTEGTMSMLMGSNDLDTFIRVTRSKESTIAGVTDAAFVFPALQAGQAFKLPHSKVTTVVVPGKVENVDYVVFRSSGVVKAMVDFVEAIPACTYSASSARAAGITAAGTVTYTVHVTDEKDGEYTCFFKFQPNLPSDISLVSPNEWGQYPIEGTLLLDESRPANGDLGQFGYRTA